MKIATLALLASSIFAPQSGLNPPAPDLRTVQLQSDRTITSQPSPSLGSGSDLGTEGGPFTSPPFEPRSRIRPYRWMPGAEILGNRDLGLGLVEPDPLQSDPLIGDPTLDGADSGVTGVPGSSTTIPGTAPGP